MTEYKFVRFKVEEDETFDIPDEATNVTYTRTDYPRREISRYEIEYILPVEEDEDEGFEGTRLSNSP